MTEYTVHSEDAFDLARMEFEQLISTLQRDVEFTAFDAESEISSRQQEISRQLLQAFYNRQHEQEVARPLEGSDGVLRTKARRGSRQQESTFGEVVVYRLTMHRAGVAGLRPLDMTLNLPKRKYSFAVQRRVCRLAARVSFDAAIDELESSTAAHVPKRQFELVVQEAATDFDAFYEAVNEEFQPDDMPLVMSCDCKGVVMHPDGLTEYTRNRAEKSQHKLKGRLSIGEKRNRKRMACVTAIYDQKARRRTPVSLLDPSVDTTLPRPQRKRVFASVEKPLKQAVREMFDEAERRDPEHRRRWVVLVDGHSHQKTYIRNEASRRGVEVTMVLDIIHAAEYLWDAVWRRYDKGDPEAEDWVRERLLRILQGRVSSVAAGIRRSATMRGLTGTDRKVIDQVADYFLNNKSLMQYDEYLDAGFAIGTGVIEGACRYLVKDRMEITGARWGLESAEAVLRLRALIKNGNFDEYWAFHMQQEKRRNYKDLIPANDNEDEAFGKAA